MDDRGARPSQGERHEARGREQVQDRGRVGTGAGRIDAGAGPGMRPDAIAQPGQHRRVLREDAELTGLRRPQLERHAIDRQRPWLARRPR